MIVYKLFKQRRDGSLGPLFINARQRIAVGEWMQAEDHPTAGFAHRPGWHCCFAPEAPHLAKTPKAGLPRVWARCEVDGPVRVYERPKIQGGNWVLAPRLRLLAERRAEVRAGWGADYAARVRQKGKLTAWERLAALADPGAPVHVSSRAPCGRAPRASREWPGRRSTTD